MKTVCPRRCSELVSPVSLGKSFDFGYFTSHAAISINTADIAYGYILYNFKDLNPNDKEVRKVLEKVWKGICGKKTMLVQSPRAFTCIGVRRSEYLLVRT